MTISYFVYFEDATAPGTAIGDADRHRLLDLVRRLPGLSRANLFTPTTAGGPFTNDGPPPRLALQLVFPDLPSLESVLAPEGALQALTATEQWPCLSGTTVTQQAMITRPFPVPNADTSAAGPRCSYLVHYPGHAEDLNAWLRHYLTHHSRLMMGFAGIREIEIFTRADWCDSMPWRRVHHMQRNKIVFDNAAALTAALESPALDAMRKDFRAFPPFTGGNIHYPMHTYSIIPARI
ncbi:MAG: hypothetical protein EPO23_12675 [Xanthobacteraceae bacterium]|nr:MAG: hypothetical protein EPO23_12675 [Xanthobacteraceae bacterium]